MGSELSKNEVNVGKAGGITSSTNGLGALCYGALRNKYVLGLIALTVVAILLNIKFIMDFSSERESFGLAAGINSSASDQIVDLIRSAKLRFILLLLAMISVSSIALYIIVKNFMRPIEDLRLAIAAMSKGNLSASARIGENTDVNEASKLLNAFSANIQEVMLFTGTNAGTGREAAEQLQRILANTGSDGWINDATDHLRIVRKSFDGIISVSSEFEFFHTQYDGRKVVADAQGRKASNIE